MKIGTAILLFGLLITGALIGFGGRWLHRAHTDRRGHEGRVLRSFNGEPYADQFKNECAEDLRAIGIEEIQKWAVTTLAQYENGMIKTYHVNSMAVFGAGDHEGLYSSNVLDSVLRKWRFQDELIITIKSEKDCPNCIHFYWTLPFHPRLWAEIGPTNYFRDTNRLPEYLMVAPGVYVHN